MSPMPNFVEAVDLATACGCSVNTLIKLAKETGNCIKPGRRILFTERDADVMKAYFREGHGHIYFIQSGRFVKIGFTMNLTQRLNQYKTNNPGNTVLLYREGGTKADEAAHHNRFRQQHHRGEWFRYEKTLRLWLEGKIAAAARR